MAEAVKEMQAKENEKIEDAAKSKGKDGDEKEWTKEQRQAIEKRERTLLVSAAAGSGKTATLTQRIVETILYDDKADISKMVVVTFTRPAAAELRERISAALSKEKAKNPDDTRLERQLLLMPSAKIGTIHSFCADIIRQNASAIGLSPAFRVCETTEKGLILFDIAKTLVEECYSSLDNSVCNGEDFCRLADNLTSTRSEGSVEEILIGMYENLNSFVDRVEALGRLRDNFQPFTEFFDTVAGAKIKENVASFYEYYRQLYENDLKNIRAYSSDRVKKNHLPAYEEELSLIKGVLLSLDSGYEKTRKAILRERQEKFGGVNAEHSDEYDLNLKEIRKELWLKGGERDALAKGLFSFEPEQIEELQARLYNFHSTLYLVLSELDRRFRREKLKRNICDYGDLEHYAHELLYNGKEKSSIANEIREYYDAIYVDEYQDVSPIQHEIFAAISREDNCFMVGDIKQSIYSFRMAEPDIFAEMKGSFTDVNEVKGREAASIFMSSNFRCDETVVNFTNLVFDALFGVAGASIYYEKKDRLIYAKKNIVGYTPVLPKVALIAGMTKDEKERMRGIDADGDEEETEVQESVEAEYVASEIERLFKEKKENGKNIKPSDVIIMLRKSGTHGRAYYNALRARGIPVSMESQSGFFDDPEVLLALCLFNVVDNPQRDIYLMGLLHSPLYGFSLDELAAIRLEESELSLYDALCLYTEKNGFKKGERFISELEDFRKKAQGLSADRLISYLYRETGILSMCGENTEKGHGKLLVLYNAAREFEASSFKGLYNFLLYINGLIEKGKSLVEESVVGDVSGVRIMSIHKAKGLEAPVCFVSNTFTSLDPKDVKNDLVFNSDIGFSPKFLESEKGLRAKNPVRQAIIDVMNFKSREEELRVLYVALTRARERLYVTGKLNGGLDNFLDKKKREGRNMCEYSVLHASKPIDWILAAMAKENRLYCELVCAHKKESGEFEELDIGSKFLPSAPTPCVLPVQEGIERKDEAEQKEKEDKKKEETLKNIRNTLLERFDFEYPFEHLKDMPAKVSVSKLKPELLGSDETSPDELKKMLGGKEKLLRDEKKDSPETANASVKTGAPDEANAEKQEKTDENRERKKTVPKFISEQDTEQKEEDSAARGTATHLFMQFADFERLRATGAEEELSVMTAAGFISKKDAETVFIDELERFAHSDFLSEILSCANARREFRFNTQLDASLFASGEKKEQLKGEMLLVQGVIDCILEYDDGSYTVIDYKTDRLSSYELENEWAARKKLSDRHREQLKYYALACEKMYGRPPKATKIYSLPLGKAIDVKL